MPAADHRLTTEEMARFVADGFLRFDALVPQHINECIVDELEPLSKTKIRQIVNLEPEAGAPLRPASLTPLSECYPAPSLIGELLRLPQKDPQRREPQRHAEAQHPVAAGIGGNIPTDGGAAPGAEIEGKHQLVLLRSLLH